MLGKPVLLVLPRANEENARGLGIYHAQGGTQFSGASRFGRLRDLHNIFRVQIEAVEIRATRSMNIFRYARFSSDGDFQQALPETLPAKYPALGSASPDRSSRCRRFAPAPSNTAFVHWLAENGREGSASGNLRQRGGEFRFVRVKSGPGVAVKMVDDRAGMQELPDARRIFSRDAEDHVQKFFQAKRLPHERTHGDVSGFFLRVANGNRFRQWHGGRIRGRTLKSRYQRNCNCLENGVADRSKNSLSTFNCQLSCLPIKPFLTGALLRGRTTSSRPPSCLRGALLPP